MTLAIISTVFSSVCMALMIVTDKHLLGQCYDNKPRQAWFISSLAGSAFGLILTFLMWMVVALISPHGTLLMIFLASVDLFFWQGFIVFIAGIIGIQILFHYFNCFSEDASSASIAAWIAATPIFILLTFALVGIFSYLGGFPYGVILIKSIHPVFVIGTIIATIGLIVFEYISNPNKTSENRYKKSLFFLIIYNVIYSILLQYILSQESQAYSHGMYILALLPYLWVGFASGARDIFNKIKRVDIINNWRTNIKKYWQIILLVEVIGMFVFYFEYFGLADLNAAYVSVITSSHVLLVYFLDFLLIVYLANKNKYNIKITAEQNLKVDASNLLYPVKTISKRILEVLVLMVVVIGIALATIYL